MVLTKETARRIEENKGYPYSKIMFLDTKHMDYQVDTLKFGWGVEVLNQINFISWANKLCDDLKSDYRIDASILYDVIDAIYGENSFNDEQLARYFHLVQEMEKFFGFMMKWHDTDRYYSPYELEYFLLGMPIDFIDDHSNLSELSEGYGGINCDVRFERIEIDEFIKEAKKLVGKATLTKTTSKRGKDEESKRGQPNGNPLFLFK